MGDKKDARLLFLDACVLAAPVTRTLLLVGADLVGLRTTWSALAEAEANRHLPARAMRIDVLRTKILGRVLGPTGTGVERFSATASSDRQILADAVASGAGFIVTTDVDDYAEIDLLGEKVAAVNPDLLMASRYSRDTYRCVLEQLVANMGEPPRSPMEMHSLIAKRHRRLFRAHADLYTVAPAAPADNEARVLYRGARCIRCGAHLTNATSLREGLGPDCRAKV